jgi:hypothetical protein
MEAGVKIHPRKRGGKDGITLAHLYGGGDQPQTPLQWDTSFYFLAIISRVLPFECLLSHLLT